MIIGIILVCYGINMKRTYKGCILCSPKQRSLRTDTMYGIYGYVMIMEYVIILMLIILWSYSSYYDEYMITIIWSYSLVFLFIIKLRFPENKSIKNVIILWWISKHQHDDSSSTNVLLGDGIAVKGAWVLIPVLFCHAL